MYKALSLSLSLSFTHYPFYPILPCPPYIYCPMRPFQGLSLQVITQTGALKLHHDPDDDPSSEPRTRQRYIEAVTGATFKIRVHLHKDFELYTLGLDDAVRITIFYDDQKTSWFIDLTRAAIVQEWRKGKSIEHTFSHVSNFCQETQQWKQGATSFGALHTSKCHGFAFTCQALTASIEETTDSQAPSDVQNLGRIQVKVARVHRDLRSTPIRAKGATQKPITEVTEKILKGKAIANTVRYGKAQIKGITGKLTLLHQSNRRSTWKGAASKLL